MSLYEIMSMLQAIARRRKNITPVSDDEFAAGMDMLRHATRNDPSVRLH